MEAVRNWPSINRYWAVGYLCALLVGAGTRLVLSNTATNPILNDRERFPVVSQLTHYLFHPVTYVVVVALFVLGIVRLRCVGFWSILFSFIVGGISATIILALR
jgi:cytochrome b561